MQIGILGSGLMGGKLGTLFARAGHEVVFSRLRMSGVGAVDTALSSGGAVPRSGKGEVMNTLFLVVMVVEGLVAIAFIALPGQALGQFGVTPDATAISFARLFGSAVLAFPVLLSYARASADAALRRVAVRVLFVYFLVSTVLLAITQLGGLMNALGWILVALHVAFTIWFGAFLTK